MTILQVVQLVCSSILIAFLLYYLLLLLVMKRATKKTNIMIPQSWQIIIIGNLIFIASSILFIFLSTFLFPL